MPLAIDTEKNLLPGAKADIVSDNQQELRPSSFVDKDFRGVFRATINTSGSRLLFLVGGGLLLLIGPIALGWALYLIITPLYTVVVNISDANLSDLSDVNWSNVHWSLFTLCLIAGLVASWFGFLFMRKWTRLRKLPEGILGKGIRVRSNGSVELGSVRVRPASYREIQTTGRGQIQSIKWKRLARYTAERELLVNLMHSKEAGLMVSHLILKGTEGREVMFLGVTQSGIADQDRLWALDESGIVCLDRGPAAEQLDAVSRLLAPIARREGGLLALTLTEDAGDADAEADASEEAEAKRSAAIKQEQANEQLGAGVLPEALLPVAGVVEKYGYALRPNLNAEKFRGW
jgi:hypothetical protein